ncbi:MAG TPA: TRAP transporter large permease [Syntrophorhabdales bacterium]|nr:TRAP transporter large permease [Syntrophorhabdales bacterium]
MTGVIAGIVALFVLLLLFATGIELGFAMAAVGFVGYTCLGSFHSAVNLLGRDMWDVFSSYGFTVFPLFILMGQVGFNAGIAVRLYDTAHKFIGHIPGGLAMATVIGAAAFKSICGSGTATSATFASVAIPEMDRYGYDKKLSTGVVASVGTLGTIIPPSVFLIVFCILTEQSVGKMFLAGIIPGLIAAFFFIVIIYGWARLNPALAPRGATSTWKERRASLPEVLWVLLIFMIVVGGIMTGFFTPTEAGGIGTFAVIVLAVVKRDLTFKKYTKSLHEALGTACMLLMLIAGSTILGHFIAVTNIPQMAADWIVGLPLNRYLIMFFICLVYELGGSFIDDLAFMVLATPIFYPAVLKLGFDPIWFGMVVCVTVMIGVVIPPVAICVFVVQNITKVPIGTIYKGVCPFLISLVLVGVLLFLFPSIALWLPSLLMK